MPLQQQRTAADEAVALDADLGGRDEGRGSFIEATGFSGAEMEVQTIGDDEATRHTEAADKADKADGGDGDRSIPRRQPPKKKLDIDERRMLLSPRSTLLAPLAASPPRGGGGRGGRGEGAAGHRRSVNAPITIPVNARAQTSEDDWVASLMDEVARDNETFGHLPRYLKIDTLKRKL